MEQPSISLYEYAKQIVANEAPMDPIVFNEKMIEMAHSISEYKYVMLLCHDRRDYTIFYVVDSKNIKNIAREVSETICNRGTVLLVDKQSDGAYEIWIRDNVTNENFAYYLFDYENGVVKI